MTEFEDRKSVWFLAVLHSVDTILNELSNLDSVSAFLFGKEVEGGNRIKLTCKVQTLHNSTNFYESYLAT